MAHAKALSVAAGMVVAHCAPLHAETLQFRGTAVPTCSFTSPVDGTIVLQPDLRSWATATPATIIAVNTAPATVTVTHASDWTSSPSATPASTFAHSVNLSGANVGTLAGSGAARSGPLTALGSTTLAVSLSATANAPYPAGVYVAQVTATCAVN